MSEDLIAIARLKGSQLQTFDIPACSIVFDDDHYDIMYGISTPDEYLDHFQTEVWFYVYIINDHTVNNYRHRSFKSESSVFINAVC